MPGPDQPFSIASISLSMAGDGVVVDAEVVQRQQEQRRDAGNQQLSHSISKFRDAYIVNQKAHSSMAYAVFEMITTPGEPWRNPSGFSVLVDGQRIDIEEFNKQATVTFEHKDKPPVIVPAFKYLSRPHVNLFDTIQHVYYRAMFPGVAPGDSLAETIRIIAWRVCVIIALQLHSLESNTLHSKLVAIAGQAEIAAGSLDEIKIPLQHDLGSTLAECMPAAGGLPSPRLLAPKLLKWRARPGLLPLVAKVIDDFAAAGKLSVKGMKAARKRICGSDPATKHLLKVRGLKGCVGISC
jgi:hypothetical protein